MAKSEARAKADKSSSYPTRTQSTSSVRANVMENEREEGEPEEVNQMQGRSNARGGQNSQEGRPPRKFLYTQEEWAKVKVLGLCFHCGKDTHKVGECADRKAGKPKTKATAAALNA
jgi:hypothetical protein